MNNDLKPYQISLFDFTYNIGLQRERERESCSFHFYDDITSIENLLVSWQEFLKGKRKRKDVIQFSLNLMDNIFDLHNDLVSKKYKHSLYHPFKISDPKPRNIHKAKVRDRLLHHAIYRNLYPYFDRKFIFDSYSCRVGKGTHKAINRFTVFGRKSSQNNTKTVWVLKCDVKKFFASIHHQTLKNILAKYIQDPDSLWLLAQVIDSFKIGLPLGNLTSQLLVNVYMNEFDQFVKRKLKVKYYIRYADDFVIFSQEKAYLQNLIPKISDFLVTELKLSPHPNKVSVKTLASGVDFLGWVNFPNHRVIRTSTKRRMFKRLQQNQSSKTRASYLGILSHGNTYKITQEIFCYQK